MTAAVPDAPYPVRVEGHLEQPSRWLWLLKWLLAIPHFIVLAFLWVAFIVLAIVAFGSILFTGRYPRGIFDFNVGVLRWSWRVGFYAFCANGTDRYPPFTLADVPDYPARLDVTYPTEHRRGFSLIGWWLAGIPHYLIAGIFLGGEVFLWGRWEHWAGGPGLIGLLVLVALLVLLFRGTYPRSIFDLVLGLNRWVLRVAAYAAFLTPEYPPFRVDSGETEPGGVSIGDPEPNAPAQPSPSPAPAAASTQTRWTAGRIIAIVFGAIVLLLALASIAAGGAAVVYDQTQRDASGYLMTDPETFSTGTYALVSDSYRAGTASDLVVLRDILGTVRVRADSSAPLFVGIAPADSVSGYLGGAQHAVVSDFDGKSSPDIVGEGPPSAPPTEQTFWAASTHGSGPQTLSWVPRDGSWRIVVMKPDASQGVTADIRLGARIPDLLWIGVGFLAFGAFLLALGGGLVFLGVHRARRG